MEHKIINPEFEHLFTFDSKEEEIEHDAKMLMFRFLDKVQEVTKKQGISRKELATRIGTSSGYLTELFRGHKLLNLTTIARLQKALNITFDINLKTNY